MIPGERLQSSLRMRSEENIAFMGAQMVQVMSVDYSTSRLEVYNSNGTRWVRVIFRKTSGVISGDNNMPNVGDWGVILPVNGDAKSAVWIGSVNVEDITHNLVNDSNAPPTPSGLIHRDYSKHETGSFRLLDKLGNLLISWYKKATQETDRALQNLTVSLDGGVLTITHYRGDPSVKGMVIESDQNGNVNLQNFNPAGTLLASSVTIDNGGGFGVMTASGSQIFFDEDGNLNFTNGKGVTFIMEQATGKVTLNSTDIELGSGTVTALLKAGFITKYAAHFHISAAPGDPTGPPTVVVSPTDPTVVTQNVEAS